MGLKELSTDELEIKKLSTDELGIRAHAMRVARVKAEKKLESLEAEMQHRRDVRSRILTDCVRAHVDVLLLLIPDHNGLCSDAEPRKQDRTDRCDRCWLITAKRDRYADLSITSLSFSFE